MRRWRHGRQGSKSWLFDRQWFSVARATCPAGELCSPYLFYPLSAASFSEGTGVVLMHLDTQVSNRCTGKHSMQMGSALYLSRSFFMTCIPFSDLLSRLSISLPLKGLLQKLPNSQNSLIYKQCMLLKHHLPIYWCPYSFISQSLCSSTIASPVVYPTSPSGWIFPGTSNLTCPLWTHNLTFPNLLLPSPSLAQFMVPPSSWSPCLESLAPPLLLPSSLTPHCATQSVFH